ncbi:hypothetical protein H0H93_008420 [Arthromyces matolae]|nr:hypothetical protein H0H93_008420 [Arthromyces matolae]
MPLTPAPALLVGLGARLALDHFTRSGEATVRDFILIGLWQGVGLHYASKITTLAIVVGFGITAKLYVDFKLISDITMTVTTLLGIALGVLCTECLSQFFDPHNRGLSSDQRRQKAPASHNILAQQRDRLVQFNTGVAGDGSDERHRAFRETVHAISDITSVGSHSDMIGPSTSLSPLEVEIKTLRARAALADSERRRFKEEKKWAISQGNLARASQMKSQVKHYTALMQKFNHDADVMFLQLQGNERFNSDPFFVTNFSEATNIRPIPEEFTHPPSKPANQMRQGPTNSKTDMQERKSFLAKPPRTRLDSSTPLAPLPATSETKASSSKQPPRPRRDPNQQANGQTRSSSEAKRLQKQLRS